MRLRPMTTVARDFLRDGARVVAATLIEADGSSPFEPGATMLVDDRGRAEGSVTGGCVEGALFEEAQAVLQGAPAQVHTYGISDAQAADVGLMCGGTVYVFVHEIPPEHRPLLEAVDRGVADGRPAALAVLVDGQNAGASLAVVDEERLGGFGLEGRIDDAVEREARGFVEHGMSALRRYGAHGEVMGDDLRVFIHAFAAPPQLIIFGAIDYSAAVAVLAKAVGYEVTICDARRTFARGSRFAVADHVVVEWPDRFLAGRELGPRDAVLVFTHDPKFDEPALLAALASGCGYVGALGSRRTHEDRSRRLTDAGLPEDQLSRIASPCGLDIGARTPSETAVSILAEIVARSSQRSGKPLSETKCRIHAPRQTPIIPT